MHSSLLLLINLEKKCVCKLIITIPLLFASVIDTQNKKSLWAKLTKDNELIFAIAIFDKLQSSNHNPKLCN